MKDAWPVKALGIGGRHFRGDKIDQNFDTYAIEYTFPDGAKLFLDGVFIPNFVHNHSTTVTGSKGIAVVSQSGHLPAYSRTYKHMLIGDKDDKTLGDNQNLIWAYGKGKDELNPYQLEWEDLVDAVIHDKPYSEVQRGTVASLVTAMGRMAVHTGQEVTYEEMFNSEQDMAPDLDKMTFESPAPVLALADGSYPVPQPGLITKREY